MFKKIIISLLIICFAASAVACTGETASSSEASSSSEISSESSESEESEPEEESSEESEESSSEAEEESSASAHTEGPLPAIEASEEFIEAFEGNVIDQTYISDISKATTITDMVNVATAATTAWEREINYIYSALIDLTSEDMKKTEEEEQTAWANDLPIVTSEIQASTADSGSSGKFDAAFQIMLVYRDRAITLYSKVFEHTATVDFAPETGEVVG